MHSLIHEIENDNRWRDGDFAKFKMNAQGVDEVLWNRMCIPMVYAHWEGFVVSSTNRLIKHLKSLDVSAQDVSTHIMVVALGKTYDYLKGKHSFEQKVKFTESFMGVLQESLKFKDKVDAKSNLNSTVLEEICSKFQFDYERFGHLTGDIDKLVTLRNKIAHGENAFMPSTEVIRGYINTVSEGMDIYLEEIDAFLQHEKYLIKNEELTF